MRTTFYGNKVSQYGLENGYVDYHCLAQAFDMVLCNNITAVDEELELVSGSDMYYCDNETNACYSAEEYNDLEDDEIIDRCYEYYRDIYQYYIVSANAVDVLKEADEIVFYSEKLDVYVWGVTHYGTSWDYVLTNIKLEDEEV